MKNPITNKQPTFFQKVLWIFLAAVAIILILNFDKVWGVFAYIIDVFSPVLIGICIAFVINPIVEVYHKAFVKLFSKKWPNKAEKISKPIAIFLALLTLALILAVILLIAIPEISDAFQILSNSIQPMIQSVFDWVNGMAEKLGIEMEPLTFDTIGWSKITEWVANFFTSGSLADLISNIPGAVASVAGVIFNIVIGIVFAISILGNKVRIFKFMNKWMDLYLKPKTHKAITDFFGLISDAFRNFVTGQLTEACILFILCMLGMSIFRFPYVVATSAIIAITALIPMFGAWIGGGIGALLALTISPLKMVLFIVFVVVLQLIDNYIVYPRVIGNQLSMPSLLVMAAVVVGGNIFGLLGMVLCVPICSVIYVLVNRAVNNKYALMNPIPEPEVVPVEEPVVEEPEVAESTEESK